MKLGAVLANVPGPLGPGVVTPSAHRGLGQELKVDDRFGAMTHRGSNTVITSITTTNDNDVLALCTDVGGRILKVGIKE